MKKILLSLFLFVCYNFAFAVVTMQLESSEVQTGQPVRLILTLDGAQTDGVPDLTPLQQDFTIVGTERSMNYSVINGRANSVNQWIILLMPKRTGTLPIPPIQIGQEKTLASSVKVTAQAPDVNKTGVVQQDQEVMLLTEVSVDNPYVNQQVIYTVKLYTSRRLLDADYQPPQVEDALLIPLGAGNRYQTINQGKVYAVEEQQYAVFPQKSGELKIKPPTFQALVYDAVPQRVNVQAKTVVLQVKPVPAHTGKGWLPAKQVSLSEAYDRNTTSLPEGSTLVRTVSLQAVAVPAQLLPTLDFASSNQFSVYPEKPSEKNTLRQHDLVGSMTVKVTYLLNRTGQITIPALKLPWFNTVTGKEEISSLPAITINVTPVSASTKQIQPPHSLATNQLSQLTAKAKPTGIEKQLPELNSKTNLAWWVAGGFAIAWMLTLGLWFWQKQRRELGQSKGHSLKRLREACLNNNPYEARDALMKWAHLQWPDENILNLTDLEKRVSDRSFRQQINELAQALYHDTPQKSWQGEALWRCVNSLKTTTQVTIDKTNPLPPIHRL